MKTRDLMRARDSALFIIAAIYFSVWALVKPPFQAPDEFQHLIKAESIALAPWIARSPYVLVPASVTNPLVFYSRLHELPFHPETKIDGAAIDAMRATVWKSSGSNDAAAYYTGAYSYPPIYYAYVFGVGQLAAQAAGLSPYDALYWCRLVTGFLCAAIWVVVARGLRRLGFPAVPMVAAIVLLPMVGFISSSVSPDGPFVAFASLTVVQSLEALVAGGGLKRVFVTTVLTSLIKPAALILIPAIVGAATVGWFIKRRAGKRVFHLTAVLVAAMAACGVAFYYLSPPSLFGTPVSITLQEYLTSVRQRAFWLFEGSVGILGWLDYQLPPRFYEATAVIFLVNVPFAVLRGFRNFSPLFLVSFSVLFLLGTLAGEYLLAGSAGLVLQGRYLLPAGIGLAAALRHRSVALRITFCAWLLLLNVILFRATVERYYGGDYALLLRARPFSVQHHSP